MKGKEIRRAIFQCSPEEKDVLFYLASVANYNPKGYVANVYGKRVRLKLGQVPPARISNIFKHFKISRRRIYRILDRLVAKRFIDKVTFPRGKKYGKGYSIITVGVISGVRLSVTLTYKSDKVLGDYGDIQADNSSYNDNSINKEKKKEERKRKKKEEKPIPTIPQPSGSASERPIDSDENHNIDPNINHTIDTSESVVVKEKEQPIKNNDDSHGSPCEPLIPPAKITPPTKEEIQIKKERIVQKAKALKYSLRIIKGEILSIWEGDLVDGTELTDGILDIVEANDFTDFEIKTREYIKANGDDANDISLSFVLDASRFNKIMRTSPYGLRVPVVEANSSSIADHTRSEKIDHWAL